MAAGIDPHDVPRLDPALHITSALSVDVADTSIETDRAGRTMGERLADIELVTELMLRGTGEKKILAIINASRPYQLDMRLLRRDLRYAEEILASRTAGNIITAQARESARSQQLFGEIMAAWDESKTPTIQEEVFYESNEKGEWIATSKRVRTINNPVGNPRMLDTAARVADGIAKIEGLGSGKSASSAWEDQIVEGLRNGRISPAAVKIAFPDTYVEILARAGLSMSFDGQRPTIIDNDAPQQVELE